MSGQVKSGDKSSQDCSSLAKIGQINLQHFKSSWDRAIQLKTGQVNL